jgi:hypothetical protein
LKLRTALCLCLLVASAYGQGVFRNDVAMGTRTGSSVLIAIPSGVVTVCTYPATVTGSDCSPHATLSSSKTLSPTIANPVGADTAGNYNYAVAPGTYVEVVSGSGFSTYQRTITVNWVTLEDDQTITGIKTFSSVIKLGSSGDAGISRLGAGILGVGNGTASDVSARIAAKNFSTTSSNNSLDAAGAGHSTTFIDIDNTPNPGSGYIAAFTQADATAGARNALLAKTAATDTASYVAKFESGGVNRWGFRADGQMESTGVTFANLGTPNNGTLVYCSNCTIANPCASGGTGAFAKRLNGVWVCN